MFSCCCPRRGSVARTRATVVSRCCRRWPGGRLLVRRVRIWSSGRPRKRCSKENKILPPPHAERWRQLVGLGRPDLPLQNEFNPKSRLQVLRSDTCRHGSASAADAAFCVKI